MLCCQCGTALLVINPFQILEDEKGEEKLFRYAKKLQDEEIENVDPHLFKTTGICI